MTKQIVFIVTTVFSALVFLLTSIKVYRHFKLTKPAFKIKNIGKRFILMFDVAFLQTKILRKPLIGFLHALVFWGFCIILFGSVEMIIDGISGHEKVLSGLGAVYDIFMASGDIFAAIISVAIIIFLFRRLFLHIKRFEGPEMKKKSHLDANIALTIILVLMLSLQSMNIFYIITEPQTYKGIYPVSKYIAPMFANINTTTGHILYEASWWTHIVLIFIFANILPYSKHFHVFMSVPNVFLSRLEPLGKLTTMENITKEVKMMMNPETAFTSSEEDHETVERFGVLDAEDVNWKNYLDSLACTQCGRCTSVCPANITGKRLSPRKIMIDLRARMKEKGKHLIKNKDYNDNKSLIKTYISPEELWACTTCNACAQECPININHPSLIIDMRRYLVMEESVAPPGLNAIFSNVENNGAPWQFSQQDRMLWADNLEINNDIPEANNLNT